LPLANFTNKTIYLERISLTVACVFQIKLIIDLICDESHCQRYNRAYHGEKQVAF